MLLSLSSRDTPVKSEPSSKSLRLISASASPIDRPTYQFVSAETVVAAIAEDKPKAAIKN